MPANDAVVLDTTALDIEAVFKAALEIVTDCLRNESRRHVRAGQGG
jgi:hypothetical protein